MTQVTNETQEQTELRYLTLGVMAIEYVKDLPDSQGIPEWELATRYLRRLKEEKRRAILSGGNGNEAQ